MVKTTFQSTLATARHGRISSEKEIPVHVIATHGWDSYSLKGDHVIPRERNQPKNLIGFIKQNRLTNKPRMAGLVTELEKNLGRYLVEATMSLS